VLDPEEVAKHPLRVGLSMQVEVDLRDPAEEDTQKAQAIADASSLRTSVFDEPVEGADAMISKIIQDNSGS